MKFLLPSPTGQPTGFKNRTPLTRDGAAPAHGSQRWYDAESGRLMQKDLEQVITMSTMEVAQMATATKPKKAKATGGPMILEWDTESLCWTRGDGQGGLLDAAEQKPWPRGKERWPTSGTLALTADGWVMVPRD